jgi:hypothetical protein
VPYPKFLWRQKLVGHRWNQTTNTGLT